jgi:hypothetical protein
VYVVNRFRLLKSRFKKIIKDIHDKYKDSYAQIDKVLIDISDEILCISIKE